MDVHTRRGRYASSRTYPVKLPTTLGMEGAAVVTETGSAVHEYAPGDRVAYCIVWGSYAEYAAVPAWRVVKVPDALSLTRPRLADQLEDASTIRRRAADVFGALLDGSLAIAIGGRYTFDDVHEAHAALEERRMIGKPVLAIEHQGIPRAAESSS